jgi:hypothetical protein
MLQDSLYIILFYLLRTKMGCVTILQMRTLRFCKEIKGIWSSLKCVLHHNWKYFQ